MYHCERKPVSAPINFSPLIYAPATPSISQPESFSLAQISRHPLPARTNGRTKRVHANATRASRCSYCFLCDLHLHLHLHPHLPSFQPTHSTLSLSLFLFTRTPLSLRAFTNFQSAANFCAFEKCLALLSGCISRLRFPLTGTTDRTAR